MSREDLFQHILKATYGYGFYPSCRRGSKNPITGWLTESNSEMREQIIKIWGGRSEAKRHGRVEAGAMGVAWKDKEAINLIKELRPHLNDSHPKAKVMDECLSLWKGEEDVLV